MSPIWGKLKEEIQGLISGKQNQCTIGSDIFRNEASESRDGMNGLISISMYTGIQ
jgi:hypothetical protein